MVIVDPSSGFVTGGDWFASPDEAYLCNPSATGIVSFGCVSNYKKGQSIPSGTALGTLVVTFSEPRPGTAASSRYRGGGRSSIGHKKY